MGWPPTTTARPPSSSSTVPRITSRPASVRGMQWNPAHRSVSGHHSLGGSLPPRQPVHADLAQQGRIAVLGAGCSSTAGHDSSPRDGTRPPESASSTSTAPRGEIPHRSGRRHDPHPRRRFRPRRVVDASPGRHARHSLVSGRGSPGSSIQAGSSPSPFRRRSATAPGP